MSLKVDILRTEGGRNACSSLKLDILRTNCRLEGVVNLSDS